MRVRYSVFLKDVFLLAVTAFGGPQAHISMFFDLFVNKRKYLTEEELIELQALCQILPGPTSTQTITAIGFRMGGPNLAYLTLLIWILPAFIIMTTSAIIISHFQQRNISLEFTKFIQPMAVAFVGFAAYKISFKVINSKTGILLLLFSAVVSYSVGSPYILPILLLIGGAVTAIKFKSQPLEEKDKLKINWANFLLWGAVFVFSAGLGGLTQALPVRLFENFYRNGSLIFGGGQVLIPLMYTEFVEFKGYLTSEEFLSGFALVQSVPGPVFSFSAFIGTLSMREYGILGQILGGFFATAGIFLPGTFLIFFIIRFWDHLKKYRIVKASLEGINAASSGMVVAAVVLLMQPIEPQIINVVIIAGTFLVLLLTKFPPPFIIIIGLVAGFFL